MPVAKRIHLKQTELEHIIADVLMNKAYGLSEYLQEKYVSNESGLYEDFAKKLAKNMSEYYFMTARVRGDKVNKL